MTTYDDNTPGGASDRPQHGEGFGPGFGRGPWQGRGFGPGHGAGFGPGHGGRGAGFRGGFGRESGEGQDFRHGNDSGHGRDHGRDHGHDFGRGRDFGFGHEGARMRGRRGRPPFGPGFGGPGFPGANGFGPGFGGPGFEGAELGGFGPGFGFGPDAGRRGHRGGRGRQRRGDVRAAVLALLAERPMHGYEMIREIAERSGHAWKPSPGSVYPLLQQLADEELVTESEGTAGHGSKRLFTLTDAGREAAAAFTENPPWEQAAQDAPQRNTALFTAMRQLGAAVMQLPFAGTEEQQNRAAAVLNDTRRTLYAILSEDSEETEGTADTAEVAEDDE